MLISLLFYIPLLVYDLLSLLPSFLVDAEYMSLLDLIYIVYSSQIITQRKINDQMWYK